MTLKEIVDLGIKLTPMMAQYYAIKTEYEGTILFFRMGDFYEVFFEDAFLTGKLLNITVTHRGKLGDYKIPMAGMPHHAASTYIDRLTGQGYKVAICEQVEDPKTAKGIVKRAVTQVVSPGIPYDLEKVNASENSYILSGHVDDNHFYLAALDFTTGDFKGYKSNSIEEFLDHVRLLRPKEFIASMGQWEKYPLLHDVLTHSGTLITHLSEEYFTEKYTTLYIEKLIPTYKRDQIIKANKPVLGPIGALGYYVSSTQNIEDFIQVKAFQMINDDGLLKITQPTLMGLEILPKSRETYQDSLLGFLDKTQCALGKRKLRQILETPLTNLEEIKKRQAMISYFLDHSDQHEEVREELAMVRDLERILAKMSTGKSTAQDLVNLSNSVKVWDKIQRIIRTHLKTSFDALPALESKQFGLLKSISEEIDITINDEIGASLDKGNLIKKGSSKKRDRLWKLTNNTSEALSVLEQRYREETGIQKLRIKSNNVAGYFIEISKSHSDKVPKYFDRRQTLVNAERYTTEELTEFEKEILSSKDKLERLERKIFKDLVDKIATYAHTIQIFSELLALTDCFQSLAWVSYQENFVLPHFDAEKKLLNIQGGWHPLIKSIIREQFVCHNIDFHQEKYFGLITGPNMAGKTTVMREVAIIQILAQVGCYTPCDSAQLGICDYLFSRLGASDDILKGQSTFMVEMAETAEIIRHATDKSLIILDEVGRGTSTYDGLSIAWALVEHFIDTTKALTLFATHYHELIDLVEKKDGGVNLTVEISNDNGNVNFLYNLIEKGASQSFGIYVAKLAGLPLPILQRSQEILQNLELGCEKENSISNVFSEEKTEAGIQLGFFNQSEINIPEYLSKIKEELQDTDLLRMTPLKALIKLNELKANLPIQ
ncbi:MAG: DNA mismatch repair protein MutS [Bacteriovoracaceae bacterium]|nr:DNA mismatch repair protein MutS [Bacteriovoracaceae bacterium]